MEKTTDFPSAEFSLVEDVALHFTCLMDRLNEQRLFQPDLCDVDIVLVRQRSTFPAHKGVLAAYSPFFHSLFARSKQLRRVDLSLDALTSQGLQQILNFIYTSKLLVSGRTVRDVLNAATLLQMGDIAASCRDLIGSHSLRSSAGAGAEGACREEGGGAGLLLPQQVKQEAELGGGRVYRREGASPFSVRVEEAGKQFYRREDGGRGGGAEAEGEEPADGHAPFNREQQIIVEVNLNNQTLNVSKGSEGKSEGGAAAGMYGGGEGEGEENQERRCMLGQSSEEEEDEGAEEEEEENSLNIPLPALAERTRRSARAFAAAGSAPLAAAAVAATLANQRQGGGGAEPEGGGPKVRLEEKQQHPCRRCPRVFNNRWYLEKHMSVTHNRAQACSSCGKRFLLESELLLHQQTNCEKSIQVGPPHHPSPTSIPHQVLLPSAFVAVFGAS